MTGTTPQENKTAPGSAPQSLTLGEAVAAAKEESSPIPVSPDGTVIFRDEEKTPEAMPAPEDHTVTEAATADAGVGQSAAEAAAPSAGWYATAAPPASDEPPIKKKGNDKGWGKNKTPAPKPPTPKYPSFGQTHPILTVEQTMPPSVFSRLYAIPAASPALFLTLILLLQVFLSLGSRDLWFGSEVHLAGIFHNFSASDGALMQLDGRLLTGTPPLYFWFLYGLNLLTGTQSPVIFFLAAGISALLFLWATLGLGRLVGRVDKRTNLAAGIILLSSACILAITHSAGRDLLFAALMLFSCISLYRAFVSPKMETGAMVRGFILAAASALVYSPAGMLLPVFSVVLFALWRGTPAQTRCFAIALAALAFGFLPALAGLPLLQTFGLLPEASALPLEWALAFLALPFIVLLVMMKWPTLRPAAGIALLLMAGAFVLSGGTPYFHWPLLYAVPVTLAALPLFMQATPQRLFRSDFFIGLITGLILVGLWFGAVYWLRGDMDLLWAMLQEYLPRLPQSESVAVTPLCSIAIFPFMFLPWTVLVIFLPWKRLFGKTMREGVAASRTPMREGLAFLWCLVIVSLVLVPFVGDGNPHLLLPALAALAVLCARAFMGIEGRRAVFFRYTLAVLLFLSGIVALLGTLMLFNALPKPDVIGIPWVLPTSGGFFAVSIILMLSGLIMWLAIGSSRPEGVLLIMAVAAALLGYSMGGLSAPALDPVFSPKKQALMVRAYLDKGYTAAAYGIEPGTYAYYAQRAVPTLKSLDEAKPLADKGNVVLALPLADVAAWEGKPENLTEVHRQWMGRKQYVLLAAPPLDGLEPAADPYGKGFDLVEEGKTLLREYGVLPPAAKQAEPPVKEPQKEQTGTAPAPQPEQQSQPENTPPAVPPAEESPTAEPENAPAPESRPEAGEETPSSEEQPGTPEAGTQESPQSLPEVREETSPASPGEAPQATEQPPVGEQPAPQPENKSPAAAEDPSDVAEDAPQEETPAEAPSEEPEKEPAEAPSEETV